MTARRSGSARPARDQAVHGGKGVRRIDLSLAARERVGPCRPEGRRSTDARRRTRSRRRAQRQSRRACLARRPWARRECAGPSVVGRFQPMSDASRRSIRPPGPSSHSSSSSTRGKRDRHDDPSRVEPRGAAFRPRRRPPHRRWPPRQRSCCCRRRSPSAGYPKTRSTIGSVLASSVTRYGTSRPFVTTMTAIFVRHRPWHRAPAPLPRRAGRSMPALQSARPGRG